MTCLLERRRVTQSLWMEALHVEVAPFGIATTIVNPGFFRTELLTRESTQYAETSIEDYAERTAAQQAFWNRRTASRVVTRRSSRQR